MDNQVNITASEETVKAFLTSMQDLDMPKKKIILSFMKEYKINIKESRALYEFLLPKRKRHGTK